MPASPARRHHCRVQRACWLRAGCGGTGCHRRHAALTRCPIFPGFQCGPLHHRQPRQEDGSFGAHQSSSDCQWFHRRRVQPTRGCLLTAQHSQCERTMAGRSTEGSQQDPSSCDWSCAGKYGVERVHGQSGIEVHRSQADMEGSERGKDGHTCHACANRQAHRLRRGISGWLWPHAQRLCAASSSSPSVSTPGWSDHSQ